jgi:hypothetical protein
MRTILSASMIAAGLLCGGCRDLPLGGVRMELDAGQPVPVDSEGGRSVWVPQIHLRNHSTRVLTNVRVIINPSYTESGQVTPGCGYRYVLAEPLEPGAEPRIPQSAFCNAAGRNFVESGNKIVRIRLECDEGYHEQAGIQVFRPPSALDILPRPRESAIPGATPSPQ